MRMGIVEYEENADTWEVFQFIVDSHKKTSRMCNGGRTSIRIVTPKTFEILDKLEKSLDKFENSLNKIEEQLL